MAVNKVIYNGEVLVDLTSDSVTPADILAGKTAHDRSGKEIEGTCNYDAQTTDATATAAEMISGVSAYVNKRKVTGTMPNRGGVDLVIDEKNDELTIPQGYHDGSGKVKIDPVEKAKIISSNILSGVEILGVIGSVEPASGITAQAKTVTPSASDQTIIPDTGYNYLSQVTVKKIPYTETENPSGGVTVTIGGA